MVLVGMLVAMVLVLVEVMINGLLFKIAFSLNLSLWKLLPEMVSAVPAVPIIGDKFEMVGAGLAATVKLPVEVALPAGVVTLTDPVVAPLGTTTVRRFG
ncbi:hypothetical protein TK06_10100 [Pseudomonas fluorescens]|uniref:Uncharacterized protein n=1 Tax=Pseudomonas fluorescens TaxID=294 RepID=A0A159ZWD0_PSEFL|nr:hypothetical protein TK06_10100 [Pseudomonas fluorescens]